MSAILPMYRIGAILAFKPKSPTPKELRTWVLELKLSSFFPK